MRALIVCFAAVLLVCAVILGAWAYDVWKDRRHTVSVLAEAPVFAGSAEACGRPPEAIVLISVQPGAKLKVKRIRYWKDCATFDVALPDGRQGYIVYNPSIAIEPPLR